MNNVTNKHHTKLWCQQ